MGSALLTVEPINFLSMIDIEKGIINDRHHQLYGKSVKNAVIIFPGAIGSSVGAYAIFSMKVKAVAPAAIICSNKADVITASGCALSNIPLVDMLETMPFSAFRTGMEVRVDADKKIVCIAEQTV